MTTFALRTAGRARNIVALAAMAMFAVASAQQTQLNQRNLTGTVTDGSHEPLGGAVVEVQSSANDSVESYITSASGQYTFKRLDGRTDYRVWATFRGHRSHARSISKFDSHMQKVINFTVRTY